MFKMEQKMFANKRWIQVKKTLPIDMKFEMIDRIDLMIYLTSRKVVKNCLKKWHLKKTKAIYIPPDRELFQD